MSANNQTSSGGLGLGALLVLFIGLKLTGHIDWSWWWVMSSVWIPLAIFVVLAIVFALGAGTLKLLDGRSSRRVRR
jgi:uncharacterized protein (DUF983 family)